MDDSHDFGILAGFEPYTPGAEAFLSVDRVGE